MYCEFLSLSQRLSLMSRTIFRAFIVFILSTFFVACMPADKVVVGKGDGKNNPPVIRDPILKPQGTVPEFTEKFAKNAHSRLRLEKWHFVEKKCENSVCEFIIEKTVTQKTIITPELFMPIIEKEFATDDKTINLTIAESGGKNLLVMIDQSDRFFDVASRAQGFISGWWTITKIKQSREDKMVTLTIRNASDVIRQWRMSSAIAQKIITADPNLLAEDEEIKTNLAILINSTGKVSGLIVDNGDSTFISLE